MHRRLPYWATAGLGAVLVQDHLLGSARVVPVLLLFPMSTPSFLPSISRYFRLLRGDCSARHLVRLQLTRSRGGQSNVNLGVHEQNKVVVALLSILLLFLLSILLLSVLLLLLPQSLSICSIEPVMLVPLLAALRISRTRIFPPDVDDLRMLQETMLHEFKSCLDLIVLHLHPPPLLQQLCYQHLLLLVSFLSLLFPPLLPSASFLVLLVPSGCKQV
mmetsp:Transcript_35571/g.80265  ORF Transcript_35571/g.80265 Transcript_35571/m.80265 type:complete len:217 (+) Transcript_35571:989-1639(+)